MKRSAACTGAYVARGCGDAFFNVPINAECIDVPVRQRARTMIVVDHAPHAWYLLRDGERWLLDVNCNVGLADTSLLVLLSPDDVALTNAGRHAGCETLAAAIRAAPMQFFARDADRATQQAALAAILAWRQARDASSA